MLNNIIIIIIIINILLIIDRIRLNSKLKSIYLESMDDENKENLIAIKNLGNLSKKILDEKGNITLPGNVKITGNLETTGNTTLKGTQIDGNTILKGDLDTSGSIFWDDRKGELGRRSDGSNIILHNKARKKTVYIFASYNDSDPRFYFKSKTGNDEKMVFDGNLHVNGYGIFGNAKIGTGPIPGCAIFSHKDRWGTNNYAFRACSNGSNVINTSNNKNNTMTNEGKTNQGNLLINHLQYRKMKLW